ncbi:PREDICTED: protein regulator of cytokinesis 1-like isoform X2 [Priapulus caudatus]|uniref:Protein regulator of cytokinesis 1-like isoform X2 n=1 Tax=Priapulus caudatus TaxID=37621 RepID=A0ABM1E1C4_PRICU|nr:PREDICTED: protein regulator of cytokinesis 1-like isoform X2 [Priapulus caudatus]
MELAVNITDSVKEEIATRLEETLNRLQTIWTDIGILEDQKKERVMVVIHHVMNLLDEMVAEEERLRNRLLASVEQCGKELHKLCNELHEAEYEPDSGLSLLMLENELRVHTDALNKIKHERLRHAKALREEDQKLCAALCETPVYISVTTVPAKEQLEAVQDHINKLTIEKNMRFQTYVANKVAIGELMQELEQLPNTSFEIDILRDDDVFVLSKENMQALSLLQDELEEKVRLNTEVATNLRETVTSLWDRLQIPQEEREGFFKQNTGSRPKAIEALKEEIARCELLKRQNIEKFVKQIRNELHMWWEKCYYSVSQRADFSSFTNDEYTEELLEAHEAELEKVKAHYAKHELLYIDVHKRKELWDKFVEFEKRASDPNRFTNRGGGLLQEEKERKRLTREIPRLEKEIDRLVQKWEAENGCIFLVDGVPFIDYVHGQWEDHRSAQENEKQERHKKRTRQMEEEMVYGSKPVSTPRKRFLGTPTKTPNNKLRKSRLGVTGLSVFHSPTARPPRSAAKSSIKTVMSRRRRSRQSIGKSHSREYNLRSSRRALADKNDTQMTNQFSATTVNDPKCDLTVLSIGSAGYFDFAKELNRDSKTNMKSSFIQPVSPGRSKKGNELRVAGIWKV